MEELSKYISFTGRDFSQVADRKRSVAERASKRLHPALLQSLIEANAELPPSPARERNLKSLADPRTVVVITGQQLGLFGGPLFTLYKIASAVRAAEVLAAETGATVVPIFWCQSEDHDFLEINSTYLPTARGDILQLTHPPLQLERTSLEYCKIGPQIADLINLTQEQLTHFLYSETQLKLLRNSYAEGRSFSQAFQTYYAEIFREQGLLFFNPRRRAISELVQPLLFKSFSDRRRINELLAERVVELQSAGLVPQVHVRSDSPLFFLHQKSEDGPRYRLREEGGSFSLIGGEETFTASQIERLLREEPWRFSSSALLRPLVQDFLFPTACYIGGEAEVRYFSQIEPLFTHFSLPKPLIAPRNSFVLLESRIMELMESLGLSPADFTLDDKHLGQRIAEIPLAGALSVTELKAALAPHVEGIASLLKTVLLSVDQTLATPLAKTQANIQQQLDVLVERYSKAAATKDSITAERLARIKRQISPEGIPQERFYSPVYFLARYGDTFLERVLNETQPFNPLQRTITV